MTTAVIDPATPTGAAQPDSERKRRVPRAHLLILAAIIAVGLARGLFWSSVTLVFNPIDEHAHFAYVESMARHLRPPVVGRDYLSPEALELAKRTRTAEWRSAPIPPSPEDERWGLVRDSYEGVQGPAYYALMAIPYRLARPFGVLTSLYAVRVATVLLSLVAVPIAYLLARELFPWRPQAWLAAPALLVLLQGFNGNLASVTNDALVVPLAGAILLAVVSCRRNGFGLRNAVLTGGLVGLGLVTKSNMLGIALLVAVGAGGIAVVRREPLARFVRWAAAGGATAAVVTLPWLAWNLANYGALSATEEVDKITGPLQPHFPFSLGGLRLHLQSASVGYWDFQVVADTLGRYMWLWTGASLALLVTAVGTVLWRRRPREAVALGWLTSSWFVTLALMLIVIYGLFGGKSSVVGRHLYPGLVASVVVIAAAAFIVAGRWGGWAVLLVLVNLALTFEQPLVDARIDRDYTDGIIGPLAPVVDQSWGEGLVAASSVRVSPPCPASAFALAFSGSPPPTLDVVTATGPVKAPLSGRQGNAAQYLAVYTLPAPTTSPFEIMVGGAALSASADDRDRYLMLTDQPGDPVARVFCPRDDPKAFRYAQLFTPDHPSWIGYRDVKAWPTAWAWVGRLALLGLPFLAVVDRRRRKKQPASELLHPLP